MACAKAAAGTECRLSSGPYGETCVSSLSDLVSDALACDVPDEVDSDCMWVLAEAVLAFQMRLSSLLCSSCCLVRQCCVAKRVSRHLVTLYLALWRVACLSASNRLCQCCAGYRIWIVNAVLLESFLVGVVKITVVIFVA